jgi:hypothetical protein
VKIRGTVTNRFADVVQSLQYIRKSGVLTVEREGPGDFSELGTIVFQDGRIVDAVIGSLRGADAFKKLIGWTTCRFIFEPTSSPQSNGNMMTRDRDSGPSTALTPAVPVNVPTRVQSFQGPVPDFQRLGLTRLHRQLFLLVDGRRTLQELARLIGRSPQDVFVLLTDLQRVGLIR